MSLPASPGSLSFTADWVGRCAVSQHLSAVLKQAVYRLRLEPASWAASRRPEQTAQINNRPVNRQPLTLLWLRSLGFIFVF